MFRPPLMACRHNRCSPHSNTRPPCKAGQRVPASTGWPHSLRVHGHTGCVCRVRPLASAYCEVTTAVRIVQSPQLRAYCAVTTAMCIVQPMLCISCSCWPCTLCSQWPVPCCTVSTAVCIVQALQLRVQCSQWPCAPCRAFTGAVCIMQLCLHALCSRWPCASCRPLNGDVKRPHSQASMRPSSQCRACRGREMPCRLFLHRCAAPFPAHRRATPAPLRGLLAPGGCFGLAQPLLGLPKSMPLGACILPLPCACTKEALRRCQTFTSMRSMAKVDARGPKRRQGPRLQAMGQKRSQG